MRVLVPYDPQSPKTRLAEVLSPEERRAFAETMLRDVLDAVRAADADPVVLSTADVDFDEVSVCVDDRPLTAAVNAHLAATNDPLGVVMADLPLATGATVERLFEPSEDVVIARGLGGGTNALVSRDSDFTVDYHGASYVDHREIAESVGASVTTVDSFRLGVDVDEPADLVEVLLHGTGRAAAWLRETGYRVETSDGRVTLERRTDELRP